MTGGPGSHRALLYSSRDQLIAAIAGFVREGLAGGERTAVALTPEKLGMLRDELGAHDAGAVRMVDAGEHYASIGRLIERTERIVAGGPGEPPCTRIAAEPGPLGGGPARLRAALRVDAAATELFAGRGVDLLCPFDVAAVPAEAVHGARCVHAETVTEAGVAPSPEHMAFADYMAASAVRPRPGAGAVVELRDAGSLLRARRTVAAHARAAGLEAMRAEDLVLAANEIATNAVAHARGPRALRLYHEAGDLVCAVADGGPGIADPLFLFRTPPRGGSGGRGLWLAHRVCDAVEVASDGDGTVVVLRMAASRPNGGGPA